MSEQKIGSFKMSKHDIGILEKFAKINDRTWLYPDRIETIDGHMVNQKFVGGTKQAGYIIQDTNNYNFVEKIGIFNINEFISILKSISEDYLIDIYQSYIVIKTNVVSFKIRTTNEDAKIIPLIQMDTNEKIDKIKGNTSKIIFNLVWEDFKSIFNLQNIMNKKKVYFFQNENDELKIKVSGSDDFDFNSVSGQTSATIAIKPESIIENQLSKLKNINGEQRYICLTIDNSMIVPDDYEIMITQKITPELAEANGSNETSVAVSMTGKNEKCKYLLIASI